MHIANMYKYTSVDPIIKALGEKNGGASIHLSQIAISRCYTIMKQRQGEG